MHEPFLTRIRPYLIIAVLIAVGIAFRSWYIYDSEQFVISRDITYLTSPIADSGYVDYTADLREHFPATAEDPWVALTTEEATPVAWRPWAKLADSDPVKQVTAMRRIARCRALPFTEDDDSQVAELMQKSAAWFNAVEEAELPPPGILWPHQVNGRTVFVPDVPASRSHVFITRMFLFRAMLNVGHGDFDACLQSIGIAAKARDRELQMPLYSNFRNALIIESRISRAVTSIILASDSLSNTQLSRLCQFATTTLTLKDVRHAVEYERYAELDQLQVMHETTKNPSLAAQVNSLLMQQGLIRTLAPVPMMRCCNSVMDDMLDDLENPSYVASLNAMMKTVKAQRLTEWEQAYLSETFVVPRASRNQYAISLNRKRFVHIAARIHLYRRQNSAWPQSTLQLTDLQVGWPEPEDLFIDALTDKPFDLRPTKEGFTIQGSIMSPTRAGNAAALSVFPGPQTFQWPLVLPEELAPPLPSFGKSSD